MKIAAYILLFNQEQWILKTIDSCGPFVDKIYIAWSSVPWSYNPEAKLIKNNSDPEMLKKSKYYDKIVLIKGVWKLDEDQRNACRLKAIDDGMDYLITQDADEFYTFEDYNKIIQGIKDNPNYDFYKTPWICYWKNKKTAVYAPPPYGKGIICGYPEIAINLHTGYEFVRARCPGKNSLRCGSFFTLDSICHHMSFVLSDKECFNKISTWSHSHQFDNKKWFNEVWLKWTPNSINIHPVEPGAWSKTVPVDDYKLPEVLCDDYKLSEVLC